ncbi:hypothetical protein ACJ65_05960 [Kocuria rhizophila]|nr:hypothetical protein ACJ65_05960 [Kocuria rhizophila]
MIAPDEVFRPDEIENFPDGVNLARLLPAATRRPCLVGIDGRSGAGKTTLTDQLAAVLRRSHDVVVLQAEDPVWECADIIHPGPSSGEPAPEDRDPS